MIIPDTNILLYAHIPSFREHSAAKNWLEETLNEDREKIGLAWQVITSYIRIGTNPKLFRKPLTVSDAEMNLTRIIEHPLGEIITPKSGHWTLFINLVKAEQVAADLVMDAHLAALAMEHKARFATTDRDFARFRGLNFFNPLIGWA